MKFQTSVLAIVAALFFQGTLCAEPLHVFLRGGKKSHGPGAHEHEQFLKDTTRLLTDRGVQVEGGMEFPTAEQLSRADVLIMYAQEGGDIPDASRPGMETFLKKGGGVVVIHTAAVPLNRPGSSDYLKSVIGGSWVWGKTKWLEGPMSLYFVDTQHPITTECSNFDMDDEIYYDFDLSPDIHILASTYTPKMPESGNPNNDRKAAESTAGGKRTSVYDIQPQMWTYEKTWAGGTRPYRAFVSIPGHFYTNFSRLNYRAVLLRGLAWAGNRPNPNEFCTPDEMASVRYPEGGPSKPADSMAKTIIHPEFKMSLVASEPLINKPINVDWDAQGRMWVAETVEYPNGRKIPNVAPWKDAGSLVREGNIAERPARDRISILSEVDADGVAHKKSVFYEGLELVTSFVHYKQGVIACAAPDIWLLQDTDGDGKADVAQKLYTGLGTADTHAVMNNLRWGYDGWIYATHGYSTGEHVKNAEGKDFGRISSGVVRFKPDGSAIEQYSSKGGNTWGLDFGWDNELFYTQPTSGELVMNVVLPENELARGSMTGTKSYKAMVIRQPSFPAFTSDKQAYVQIDLVGSFTASAGCAIYDGGAWPESWRYSYFTTEPTINIVHHEFMARNGVSFDPHKESGREKMEFIASKDYWWRPIETRIGPDGALYICDFYNQAVIHNDTRGPKHGPANAAVRPDRDHYFGRVWKVQHKDAKRIDVPNLQNASLQELTKALHNPNRMNRMTAMRLLVENRPAGVLPALTAIVRSETESTEARIHAMWAMEQMNAVDLPLMLNAAGSAKPEIARNAFLVLAASHQRPTQDSQVVLKGLSSDNEAVKLAALRAIASGTVSVDPKIVVGLFPSLNNPWSQSAAIAAANTNPAGYLSAAIGQTNSSLKPLLAAAVRSSLEKADASAIGALIVSVGGNSQSAELSASVLELIQKEYLSRPAPVWTSDLKKAFTSFLSSKNDSLRLSALPLVARWDTSHSLKPELDENVFILNKQIVDASLSEEKRIQIATSLINLGQPDYIRSAALLLNASGSERFKMQIIAALGNSPSKVANEELINSFSGGDSRIRSSIVDQVGKRGEMALAFLDAVKNGKIDAKKLTPAETDRFRTNPDKVVVQAARLILPRPASSADKEALVTQLTPIVIQKGDARAGQEIFEKNCAICHKFGSTGKEVGPTLDGMGTHGPAALLVHIVDPNREVDPSFRAINVETKDGEQYAGVLASENPDTMILRLGGGNEMEIKKAQIKTRTNTLRSLMPEGMEALGGPALRDLLAYICDQPIKK